MMKLPEKFQFRAKSEPGFTHVAKIVDGKYQVKWARGFESYLMEKHNLPKFAVSEWDKYSVQRQIENDNWVLVVEDKKVEQELPDEFYFTNLLGSRCQATRSRDKFHVYNIDHDYRTQLKYEVVSRGIKRGDWKIIDHEPLTPEQLRSNAEFHEQIAALNQSIRLNKLDIEHKENLIKSYEARKKELESKLVKESV